MTLTRSCPRWSARARMLLLPSDGVTMMSWRPSWRSWRLCHAQTGLFPHMLNDVHGSELRSKPRPPMVRRGFRIETLGCSLLPRSLASRLESAASDGPSRLRVLPGGQQAPPPYRATVNPRPPMVRRSFTSCPPVHSIIEKITHAPESSPWYFLDFLSRVWSADSCS